MNRSIPPFFIALLEQLAYLSTHYGYNSGSENILHGRWTDEKSRHSSSWHCPYASIICGREEKTGPPEGHKSTPGTGASHSGAGDRWPGMAWRPGSRLFIRECRLQRGEPGLADRPHGVAGAGRALRWRRSEFRFQWFVNGEKVARGNRRPRRKYFKKNDWIYCLVTAAQRRRNVQLSSRATTSACRTPRPSCVPAPDPGAFTRARGPSLPDSGQRCRRRQVDLQAPVAAWTGASRWMIQPAGRAGRSSAEMAMRARRHRSTSRFEVSDLDGGKVTSAITLTFTGARIVDRL